MAHELEHAYAMPLSRSSIYSMNLSSMPGIFLGSPQPQALPPRCVQTCRGWLSLRGDNLVESQHCLWGCCGEKAGIGTGFPEATVDATAREGGSGWSLNGGKPTKSRGRCADRQLAHQAGTWWSTSGILWSLSKRKVCVSFYLICSVFWREDVMKVLTL